MKKTVLSLLLVAAMAIGLMLPCVAADAETTAVKIEPDISWYDASKTEFEISTAAQLYGLAKLTRDAADANACAAITQNKTFRLTEDIDLNPGWSADSGEAAPNVWVGIARFFGTLDGQGHTVSGLYAGEPTSDKNSGKGEFGFICRLHAGAVKNIVFLNGKMSTNATSVGLIGTAHTGDSTVENLYVDVDFSANTTSPNSIVGGIISGCYTGSSQTVTVKNVVYAGNLNVKTTGVNCASGGLVGRVYKNSTANLTDCLYAGTMDSTHSGTKNNDYTGGTFSELVGWTHHTNATCNQTRVEKLSDSMKSEAYFAENADWADNWTMVKDRYLMPIPVAEMLRNTLHVQRTEAVEGETSFSVRILSTVDSLKWGKVGYRVEVTVDGEQREPVDVTLTAAYASILAAGETVTAESLGGTYIIGAVFTGVPASGTVTFRVTPLKTTVGGTEYVGARTTVITYVDGVLQK